ncbi:hypothetical protein TBLA_0E02770 [Henningerozyma blattae CBS 6284]|uniref:Uncharacterized protein n=1 Tax=Henningerozyma blattae (strain ATCC 34711 / CBS 6284 / DSM 70876 / NBRC 10599 / NRRL Y-10934 / UCD 77-7) TaxID=1071380 RepID=I2H4N1_HENB6|nr:hypothetical protein TBLA_0E02770 [Tetrapisispora blattae CBS 6284]CCH61333.1 hypothetical protein TBLA_0E02770 [Tetrapisispora blattae CBS 6284]
MSNINQLINDKEQEQSQDTGVKLQVSDEGVIDHSMTDVNSNEIAQTNGNDAPGTNLGSTDSLANNSATTSANANANATANVDTPSIKQEDSAKDNELKKNKSLADSIDLSATVGGSQTRKYLNKYVTPTLLNGMRLISIEQPKDPLRVLGNI